MQFLAHEPVNAALADNSIFPFCKIIETLILNANTENMKQLSGPEKLLARTSEKRVPVGYCMLSSSHLTP